MAWQMRWAMNPVDLYLGSIDSATVAQVIDERLDPLEACIRDWLSTRR